MSLAANTMNDCITNFLLTVGRERRLKQKYRHELSANKATTCFVLKKISSLIEDIIEYAQDKVEKFAKDHGNVVAICKVQKLYMDGISISLRE